jgi:hypothetical protein
VWCEGKLIKDTGSSIRLAGGTYRVTGPVMIGRNATIVYGATFVADQSFPENTPMMHVKSKNSAICNNRFVGNGQSHGLKVGLPYYQG